MKSLRYFFCAIFVLVVLSANVLPQEKTKLKALPENASLAETQKWLTQAVSKAASYRRGRSSVSVSSVKFDACTISFSTSRHSDSSATETMGTTKTVTSVKNDLSIDLSQIPPGGVFFYR